MTIQSSYLSPQSQWLDLNGKVLILRQNSGAIAIAGGTGYGWGPSTDGYGLGRAQHGGTGTGYDQYLLLSLDDYKLIEQYIYFDAGVTFFEDFLRTTEFVFTEDLDGDGDIPDTTVDRALHYAFLGSSLGASGTVSIEFSRTPSDLQLVFARIDQNGNQVGGIAPYLDSSVFIDGQITAISTGLFTGSYDGVNRVLKITFNWSDFYGADYKNVVGAGSIMVSVAAGTNSLSEGAIFATAMYGTDSVDQIYGSNGDEKIFVLNGNDYVESGSGDDAVDGGAGNDEIHCGDGDDLLIGGTGTDTLVGGSGDDTFFIDSVGDVILEEENGGIDTVQSFISYSIAKTNLENVILLGTRAMNATGNDGANLIRGNVAANLLDGAGGADTLEGGAGNDTYIVYGEGETISDTTGIDLVRSYATWALLAGLENLTLLGSAAINATGNAAANTIAGNSADNVLSGQAGIDTLLGEAGNDTLDGGTGADRLTGGWGDDTYIVDNVGDIVIEKAGEGTDTIKTVLSSVSLVKLTAIENLTYTGTSPATLVGNALANVLTGSSGNDTLDGGTGADTLAGRAGNDTYRVDNVGDLVVELESEGIDIIQANVSYTLPSYVENLSLTGSLAINGAGNALNNTINGNTATNRLEGGGGNDTVDGGSGSDILLGGEGDDLLIGGLGSDTLTGGNGTDIFRFNQAFGKTNLDTITDFEAGIDKLQLLSTVFKKFSGMTGGVGSSNLVLGGNGVKALDADDYLIFNTDTGALFYDPDGSGKGAMVQIASLALVGVTPISYADFVII